MSGGASTYRNHFTDFGMTGRTPALPLRLTTAVHNRVLVGGMCTTTRSPFSAEAALSCATILQSRSVEWLLQALRFRFVSCRRAKFCHSSRFVLNFN